MAPKFNINWRRAAEIFAAEFLGTAMLVLIGCSGLVFGMVNDLIPLLLISLNFGFAVGFIVAIFASISQSHINPIITVSAIILGFIPIIYFPVYFVAQMLGGIFGIALLKVVTPTYIFNAEEILDKVINQTVPVNPLCCTVPHPEITTIQAVGVEIIISFILCLVFCSVLDYRNQNFAESIPIKFAITIASMSMSFGPYTGASMNPARSFGPALINNYWKEHWIFWVGPFVGSILASVLWKYLYLVKPTPPLEE